VGVSGNGVKIKAKNIELEGIVTANENFKILEDGSIKAKNALIEGDSIFKGQVLLGNGIIQLNQDGSGQLANGNVTWDVNGNATVRGKFESSINNDKIIIDPSNQKIQMINSNNKVVLDMSFYNIPGEGSSSNVLLYSYDADGNESGYTQMFGGRLILNKKWDMFDFMLSNDKILWTIDPERLPTKATYYGEVYRSGNVLCINATR
jgi:hypothetical protein